MGCSVYLIEQSGHAVKIGISSAPEERKDQLQSGNPDELVVTARFDFERRDQAARVEEYLHWHFRDDYIRGEWFHIHVSEQIQKHWGELDSDEIFHRSMHGLVIKGIMEKERMIFDRFDDDEAFEIVLGFGPYVEEFE